MSKIAVYLTVIIVYHLFLCEQRETISYKEQDSIIDFDSYTKYNFNFKQM